jgi:hypothetical protein
MVRALRRKNKRKTQRPGLIQWRFLPIEEAGRNGVKRKASNESEDREKHEPSMHAIDETQQKM